ncbi:MAG: hypothetical protein KGL39_53880 [Patescibacteria group bacterium]|nr:hypothetical protein [Patescibacteria group bacterium]
MTAVEFHIPNLELKSENWWRRAHQGWVLAKQRNREKLVVGAHARAAIGRGQIDPPYLVTFTRYSKSARGLDSDGLQGAFKYARDTISALLGVDDGEQSKIQFVYRQERGPFAVRVRVESGGEIQAARTDSRR